MKVFKSKKLTMPLVFLLVFSLMAVGCVQTAQAGEQYPEADLGRYEDNTIFMYVGSPLVLSGEKTVFLDPGNFDVAATVHKQRTLVPLRAVAEYFGAEVSYNAKKREASVTYDGTVYIFPIGTAEAYAKTSDRTSRIKMDTEALIIKSRTMVPVRIIAEELLKKTVDYKDGVIMISGDNSNLSSEAGLVQTVKAKIGAATKAKSDAQLSSLLKNWNIRYYGQARGIGEMLVKESAAPADGAGSAMDTGSSVAVENESGSPDYSTTNTQVKGIDEADIVKTDGKYLYYAGSNAVRIVKADGGKLTEVSIIKLPDEKYVQEIYLDKDRLILLGNRDEGSGNYNIMEEGLMPAASSSSVSEASVEILPDNKMIYPGYFRTFAFADVYDVSNPGKPALLKGHEMEGRYQSSRKSGDNVYLITNSGWYGGGVRPLMRDTVSGDKAVKINISDIMVMPEPPGQGYIILSAIDITNDSKTEVEAVTAYGSTVYMNDTALYLAADGYNGKTNITKFSIDGMNIGYAGSGEVRGSLLNQFSMDEFEGNLRVATTTWEEGNNLFVLDDSLNVMGSVTGLAKGETIYSVRFMGDKGYVVTFRTMDPLFVFDLSDPANPKVTGELKIPGFSNYLHPVGEDLILGIGMETRELFERDYLGRETPVGFRQGGLKISLFDVSDMGKPKEIANYIIGDNGSYSEALYNHKAVMVDENSQQIAFDTFISDGKNWNDSNQGALVISYGGRQIKQRAFLEFQQQEVYGKYIPYGRRVAYIGNTLYYIQDGIINAFDYDSFEKIGSLILK
ncbi:hypothetical protein MASR2M70_04220 [Bacillota bacterium]